MTIKTNQSTDTTMSAKIQIKTPELEQLEPTKADQIRATFIPMADMLDRFTQRYEEIIKIPNSEIDEEITQKARVLRLEIRKVRLETENARKAQKQQYLIAGKAIDGAANILKWAISSKEEQLEKIEKHFEILRLQELARIQAERAERLRPYFEGADDMDLGDMDAEVFEAYLQTKKKQHEQRLEEERKAAEEAERLRLEREAEQQRIREENERMRAQLEAERKQREAEEKKRAAAEKKRKAAEEKKRKAELAKLEAERKQREEAERKLREREEAERKAAAEREAAEQAELKKSDVDKVRDLIADLFELGDKYEFKSKTNRAAYRSISNELTKLAKYAEEMMG